MSDLPPIFLLPARGRFENLQDRKKWLDFSISPGVWRC